MIADLFYRPFSEEMFVWGIWFLGFAFIIGCLILGPDGNFVRALYELFLGRAGSTSEITSWVEQFGSIGRAGAAAAILASSEYRTDMVINFYIVLLHRSPSGI